MGLSRRRRASRPIRRYAPTQARQTVGVDERPLTDPERQILEILLGTGFPEAARIRMELPQLRVVGTCGCGCSTIYFKADRKGHGIGIVADTGVRDTHDPILLFLREGAVLDSLEYVWTGESPPPTFPPPEDLVGPRQV